MRLRKALKSMGKYLLKINFDDVYDAQEYYLSKKDELCCISIMEDLEYKIEEVINDVIKSELDESRLIIAEVLIAELKTIASGNEPIFNFNFTEERMEYLSDKIRDQVNY